MAQIQNKTFLICSFFALLFIAGSPVFYGYHLVASHEKNCNCAYKAFPLHAKTFNYVSLFTVQHAEHCTKKNTAPPSDHDQDTCPLCRVLLTITKHVNVFQSIAIDTLTENAVLAEIPDRDFYAFMWSFETKNRAPPSFV